MIAIFRTFLWLGLTSFGGPTAHIGYFHRTFVEKLRWIDAAAFAERLALAQFLPGPASSQLGFAIGLYRGGAAGALAAFLGFSLPSALAMALAGLWARSLPAGRLGGLLTGLELVALAIVAQAIVAMARSLCPDLPRRLIALAACAALLLWPGIAAQSAVLALAALIGSRLPAGAPPAAGAPVPRLRGLAVGLGLLVALLAALPFARPYLLAGSLVFGGGHVVLPLLREGLEGTIPATAFTAGYGMAQAVPGPLFTFASYLGAATDGLRGALIATAAIFAPGFALYAAVLPLWQRLSRHGWMRAAVSGVNAAVVGLLAAAFLSQILPLGLRGPRQAALAALLTAAAFARVPPVLIVALGAGAGAALL